MSAWLVSKQHIDALVYWIDKVGISKADKDALGKRLWSENYRSIRARYGPYDREGKFVKCPAYHYTIPQADKVARSEYYAPFDPENIDHIQQLVHCYDYQTCEHDEYETSPVKKMIDKLDHYLYRVGANTNVQPKPPWGI
jgi:hypothetical protein